MSPSAIIRALWEDIERHDWEKVLNTLHPNFIAHFPQSQERFDRSSYLRLNKEYPGEWHIEITNILECGNWVISEVTVEIDGRNETAISFFRVIDDLVIELREYWPDPFPIPKWRAGWAQQSQYSRES